MPLTRASVTVASRVMLPAYVALNAIFGLVYVLNPWGRLDNVAALSFQREVMGGSMQPWGWLFLALAALMAWAYFVSHQRNVYLAALAVCAVAWFAWGDMYLISLAHDERASVLAPVLPWFVTTACVASMLSLSKRET